MTPVYLEVGKRRVFACAVDWPGWCRAGSTEEAALAALEAAAPGFELACVRSGIAFDASSATADLEVIERVPGSATTDFGALDVPASLDGKPLTTQDADRSAALVQAAWQMFGKVAAEAPAELRKGPRGGGRDRDAIIDHVLQTEVLHARMLGVRHRPFPPGDQAAADLIRADIIAAILSRVPREGTAVQSTARGRRPARFVARRTAWHALDHAWEIQARL
jgi:hypothetical protein